MKKIVLITPFIGEWPWYFPYFIHSCRYNSSIDFVILTDNDFRLFDLPKNLSIINYSITNFIKDASDALGFEVKIDRGYKLCDFKPALGYIYPDIIKNYDYWGHCDLDIIFGNIRKFITDELLDEYDIISARHDYLTGSFALYRNGLFDNQLFKLSRDYRKVYTTYRNFCFDETNYAFASFEKGISYKEINTEIESMTHVVKKLQESGELKAYFEFQILEGLPGEMIWDKGILTYRGIFEIMYYHLIKLKVIYSEEHPSNFSLPEKFIIENDRIYW